MCNPQLVPRDGSEELALVAALAPRKQWRLCSAAVHAGLVCDRFPVGTEQEQPTVCCWLLRTGLPDAYFGYFFPIVPYWEMTVPVMCQICVRASIVDRDRRCRHRRFRPGGRWRCGRRRRL